MASLLRKINKLPLLIFTVTGSAVLAILAFNLELIETEHIGIMLRAALGVTLLGILIIRKTNLVFVLGLSALVSVASFSHTYHSDYIPTKGIYADKAIVNMKIDRVASKTDDYISVVGNITIDNKEHKSIIYIENATADYKIGDVIYGEAKLYYSNSDYNLGQGIFVKGYCDEAFKLYSQPSAPDKLKLNIDDYCNIYDGDINGLVKALLTGDKTNMDEEVRNDFSVSGTAHIIAVSGLHISILLAFCMKVLGRKAGSIAGLPIIFIYAFVSGFSPSSVRAVIMSTMLVSAFLLRRDYNTFTSYFLAMYLILTANPFSVHNVSFLLSFASVLGIITVYPAVSPKITELTKKRNVLCKVLNFILSSAAISFTATVFSNLLTAKYFTRLSLVSMVSNIFIIAPSSALLVLSIVNYFVWLFSSGLAGIISAYIITPLARLILYLNSLFSDIPFASVRTAAEHLFPLLIFLAVLSVIYALVRKKLWIFAISGIAAALVFTYNNHNIEQNNCFIGIDNVNYQPMAFIRIRDDAYVLGGGNGNDGDTLGFIDDKLFEYDCSLNSLFISKMNKANITGAMRVQAKYPDCDIYGSDYTRKEYDLDYIRYENNSLDFENISVRFETLPYNEGVITIAVGDTEILWLPSISENRMTEYFEADPLRDADIVVINNLFYNDDFQRKILDFPSLRQVIICNREEATWIDEIIDGVEITQTAGEDVDIMLPLT